MKINDTPQVDRVSATTPAAKPATPASSVDDKVSVDSSRELDLILERARQGAGAGRTAQIEQIAAAVRQGTYRPNPNQIAERILQIAEVEARLRALLER